MPTPKPASAENLPLAVVAVLDELERRAQTRLEQLCSRYEARLQAQRIRVATLQSELIGAQVALQQARSELQAQAAQQAQADAHQLHDPRSVPAMQQRLAQAFAPGMQR